MRALRLLPLLLLAACTRGNDAAPEAPGKLSDVFDSGHFLQYFNKQYSLPAGEFVLQVVPVNGSPPVSYTATVTRDDGSSENFTADNDSHTFALALPGGLTAAVSASAPACIFLEDIPGNILARDGDSDASTPQCEGGATTLALNLPHSQTDTAAYPEAFYATIDPCNERTTLDDWLKANGFNIGEDAHVIFRDTKDLGYGRNMHLRRHSNGGYSFYVRNYQLKVSGNGYGPINVDAAVSEESKYHIGTNAIEWGPVYTKDAFGKCTVPVDMNGDGVIDTQDYFTRHYTFDPPPEQKRRLFVDLDGKGPKAMPVPCIVCHGGRADPVLPDGSFPRHGDTQAKLQPLDVGSFEFSTQAGWSRAEQEAGLKAINAAVYDSYAPLQSPASDSGSWDSTMARELLESWYGGPGLPNDAFDDTYVPSGWQPDVNTGTPPAGSDRLYRQLLAENCRTCHLLRGSVNQSDIDFTRYDKFIGHSEQIQELVFDRGIMPLARVTFNNFWGTGGLAELLASYLPDFTRVDGEGHLLQPDRPIAKAGPDRHAPSPVALNGSASLNAEAYQWRVVSAPGGAEVALDGADTPRVVLSTDTDGSYVLGLKVRHGKAWSDEDTAAVDVDAAVTPVPSQITFEADIKPILQSDCTGCHAPNTGVTPPIFYSEPDPGENRDLYAEVRARVDFNDPLNSRLLRKPTNHHHYGGLRPGFDADGDHSRYDLFLNWILEGARKE